MAKHALCIGINDYPGTDSDLSGCVNDAGDWTVAFENREFMVRKLIDKQATGNAIRAAVKAMVKNAESGDSIVVQYSGHGSFVPDRDGDEPDGVDECLCPQDVNRRGPITDDELFELLRPRQKGVRVLMISDSCHSGSVTRFAPNAIPPAVPGDNPPELKVRFLPPAAYLSGHEMARMGKRHGGRPARPKNHHTALLLAACQDNEYSYDAYFQGRPNGAFTFVALRTLATLPSEATYEDWFKKIRLMLPSRQYPQTPNLFGSADMKRWKVLV